MPAEIGCTSAGALGEGSDRDLLDLLLGQYLEPPADRADQGERQADDADGHVGDQRGHGQREAQGEHHRPDGRRRQRVMVLVWTAHRPIT